jgi:hypothetical protein
MTFVGSGRWHISRGSHLSFSARQKPCGVDHILISETVITCHEGWEQRRGWMRDADLVFCSILQLLHLCCINEWNAASNMRPEAQVLILHPEATQAAHAHRSSRGTNR